MEINLSSYKLTFVQTRKKKFFDIKNIQAGNLKPQNTSHKSLVDDARLLERWGKIVAKEKESVVRLGELQLLAIDFLEK